MLVLRAWMLRGKMFMVEVKKLLTMSLTVTLFVAPAVTQTAASQQPTALSQATQVPSNWKTYTVDDGEFSVSLPVMPAMNTNVRYLDQSDKGRRYRLLGAYADGVVYAVYIFENPQPKQLLNDVIAKFFEDKPSRIISRDGFGGKEFSFEGPDLRGRSQFYITEHQIYLFRATGSTLGNPEVGIPKFFGSIKLTKNPQGVVVFDGPGEETTRPPSSTNSETVDPVFPGKDVTSKARVITKPEPRYTEEARNAQIQGTVVLRVVFSSSGVVTAIRAVSGLPHGLTERAIEAGRQIRFIPAIKDGHFVSMYVQLEYNFNLF